MKIAIVNQPLGYIYLPWTGKGGSLEIWTYEMARRLALSCKVIVYSKRGFHQKKDEYDKGVHYRRINTIFDEWVNLIKYVVRKIENLFGLNDLERILFFRNIKRPLFSSTLYYLMYSFQIARDLRKEKCDIVHIINFSQFVPIIRAFNPKIKIALRMSCEWLTQLDHNMIKKRLKEVNLIIGCSEYITNKIRYNFPEFSTHMYTVYSGVDINTFSIKKHNGEPNKNKVKKILFVGRVSPEKGLHILLEAFNIIVKSYPLTHLEIIGTITQLSFEFIIPFGDDDKISKLSLFYNKNSKTAYFNYLMEMIKKLNISTKVKFTGFIPHQKLYKNYLEADILVNPSFSESFGMTLIEAMSSQIPVVATRVGGMTEIVKDGKTGILVESGDSLGLANEIMQLISNEDIRKLMGRAAYKRVIEFFTWEKSAEKLLRLYRNVC